MPGAAVLRDGPPKKRRILRWVIGLLLVAMFLYQLLWWNPRIIVSRETTFITEPLRADGLPDYKKYVLKKYVLEASRAGVTSENNGAVPLYRAMWKAVVEPEHRTKIAAELGLDRATTEDEALVTIKDDSVQREIYAWFDSISASNVGEVANREHELDEVAFRLAKARYSWIADRLVDELGSRPWVSQQAPPLAVWIANNERPLDLVVAASQRPYLHFPSALLLRDSAEPLMELAGRSMVGADAAREAVRCLSIRAMHRLGEGRLREAWGDCRAIYRVARLVGRGPTLIDQLAAASMDRIACESTMALLDDARLSMELAQQVRRELAELGPASSLAQAIDVGERLAVLDLIVNLRKRQAREAGIGWGVDRLAFDSNQMLVEFNGLFDQAAAATRTPDRNARKIAANQFRTDVRRLERDTVNPLWWALGVFSRGARTGVLTGSLAPLLIPAVDAACDVEDRCRTRFELAQIAAALAVYRIDHRRYPEQLDDLIPDIVPSLPVDRFSTRPFVYYPDNDGQGYLLYSVSQNGIDDHGSDESGKIILGSWAEAPVPPGYQNCDLVIRLPQPPIRIPLPSVVKDPAD